MKKFVAFMLLFVLAFTFVACGKKDEKVVPTGLSLKVSQTEIEIGDTITARPTWTPSGVTETGIDWSSDNEEVATVKDGKITGVAAGTAVITAVAQANSSVLDKVTITVKAGEEPSEGPTEPTVVPTEPTEPTEPEEKIYCEKIAFLSVIKTEYYVNESVKFSYSLNDSNPDNRPTDSTVTYESSDEDVAIVSENGTIEFVGDGEVTIKIIANGVEPGKEGTVFDEVTLTALPVVNPTALNATVSSSELEPGFGTKINVTVEPENGDKRVTYESSDETIAAVDENGNVTTFVGVTGEVEITVTSVADPTISAKVAIKVAERKVVTEPESIEIKGENAMFIGEAYGIRLTAIVLPATANQGVVWTSNNESVATVDQTGYVVGLAEGTARIRATSTVNSEIKSSYFNIQVSTYVAPVAVDLNGYNIIIMNAESALSDIDPFLDGYTQTDKSYKQEAWREVENEYNCTISVVKYPDEAPWGESRISWIITNATNGTSECDLGTISSNWLYRFANANAGVDVSNFYGKYGESQMETAVKEAGSFGGKLYVASTGISPTATYVDFGLFYNMAKVEACGLEDPATMFNEGNWTYSKFTEWVRQGQAALGTENGEYALGGHPYYWWFGLTNAAGQKVADTTAVQVNITTPKSKEAAAMYYTLYQEGCIDTVGSWCESSSDGNAWFQNKALMITGYLWFVRNSSRWTDNLFGEDTRYGYVPFPYPDGFDKEQTRISQSGLSVYLYCAGRQYPAGVTTEGIYQAVNAMFLNTIKKEKADPLFDANTTITNSLLKRIDNTESIKAIQFFTASKVFFDPCHGLYTSTSATPLKTPCVNVMMKGNDYDEEFAAVYSQYDTDFKNIYGA